jgi:transposase
MRCLEAVSILEIMRLWDDGLSQREIAASVNCGKSTVNDVQQRCRLADLAYSEASEMTNAAIRERLYPSKHEASAKDDPDWEALHAWLRDGKRRNLRYAWEEYRSGKADGLGYSQFCKRYRAWREATGKTVTMVQPHEPGKELYVDWMGDTLDCVCDPLTGQLATAHFFVAALGCSGYPYVESFPDEGMESWISANIHALEYIGGAPRVIIPDNCKTAVSKPNYYDPKLNPAFSDFARHYGVAVIPARVRKPKDKSVVEGSVGWLETWLLEWLRGQKFFSFRELNKAIRERLSVLAQRKFAQRPGSRASVFEEIDKPALRPLPLRQYEFTSYVTRRVPDNYHVEYQGFYYSVPYTLFGQEVTIRVSAEMIEVISSNRERVALHGRGKSGSRYITQPGHMPEKHRRQLENSRRTGRDYLEWAATIGVNTRAVIEQMLNSQDVEITAYRACMGVLQTAKKHSPEKLEDACKRALNIGSPCYTTVKSLLQTPAKKAPRPLPTHENLRNPAEFA